ncbi:MAG: 1-(5-phosphoribosyl)-5-[(5-phosphoribosylamino)methylideneamino]imidazole-4-carboxamide isomerase [Clostridia bacterium]|nr:1-(5-phosphoribosyl)-5-[(5-phosphoribosylamino)methylideneamino]imidazole-4-carboxamide isomerase [Clostridia bacterium]
MKPIILPAIDIKDGNCVRLVKGDFNTVTKVFSSPIDSAENFSSCGAKNLHIVDLDASLTGKPENADIILQIKEKTGLEIEVGGGIRDIDTVKYYLKNGIDRVILGTAAVENRNFLIEAINLYPDKIAVGIDSENGFVKTKGWTKSTNLNYLDFAKELENLGVQTVIFTDISKDGTLSGPNFEQLKNLKYACDLQIIASGGVKDIEDIKNLKNLGVYGVICGKSLYQGTLNLKEALAVATES